MVQETKHISEHLHLRLNAKAPSKYVDPILTPLGAILLLWFMLVQGDINKRLLYRTC